MIGTPGIQGGMHGGDAGAAPYLFFHVDDMEAALATVGELGGDVEDADLGDEGSAAEYGRFKLCRDDPAHRLACTSHRHAAHSAREAGRSAPRSVVEKTSTNACLIFASIPARCPQVG